MAYYEEEVNYSPVLNTAISIMRTRGYDDICNLVQQAEISVINNEFDNWGGGVLGYTVYVNLSVKQYTSLTKERIKELEKVLGETMNEVIKVENNHYFAVLVSPRFTVSDIDWEMIGGVPGKEQLKADVEAIRDLMVSVSTGGYRIQEVDEKYKQLNSSIIQRCKKLNIKYDNKYVGLWDWYGKWSSDLPSYKSRREFINELFYPTLVAFEGNNDTSDIIVPIVELSEWERIKRTVIKIQQESRIAKEEEDFQKIGVLCREVIISLAQEVYVPEIHGCNDENGAPIGKADAVRMIGNYLAVKLVGSSNDELRAYAKTTNKLANHLTHKRDASRLDMLLTVSATIALINFIGILEGRV